MKRSTLIVFAAAALVFGAPAFAQRSHPSPGGPPVGAGGTASEHGSGMSGSHETSATANSDMSHASPGTVLSHNPVMADKIKTLTGQDAATACSGFKNLGQCVAAAHVAKNLNIPGGFDALKAKTTGSGAVSLGKAIQELAPDADAKAEAKKANKQASDDLKEASS
jgi:hypothetical protein